MNKIYHYLGLNNLALIMEQEHKHWLLKTDKQKMFQDKKTGDMYKGTVDNLGSSIILETNKIGTKFDVISKSKFTDGEINNILQAENASFPYTNMMDGLLFERIISSQYVINSQRTHYKLRFKSCEEVVIPIGNNNTDEVFPFKWIKTTLNPIMLIMNPQGLFTEERVCEFEELTNCTFFYPLDKSIQPIPINRVGEGIYETAVIDSDDYIGYPLFWFNCNEYIQATRLTITQNREYFAIGNDSQSDVNDFKVFTGLLGDFGTPTAEDLSSYKIRVTVLNLSGEETFSNSKADFNRTLTREVVMVNKNTLEEFKITFNEADVDTKIHMYDNGSWTYVNESTYEIEMETFRVVDGGSLIPILTISADPIDAVKPYTPDTGATGIYMNSDFKFDNVTNQYVLDLYEWDGIPDNIKERINSGEGMCIYAVHNTPDSVSPMTRQTAALILDPGDMMHYSLDDDEYNSGIGRVYVLSNDEAKYENNATAEHPKPARTVARICDIPTSAMQLTNISGLSPTNVVDKKYVRSECSYTLEDKSRLYNDITSRWVRPIHENTMGVPVYSTEIAEDDNKFVFRNLDALNSVDLVNHNNFRYKENLNPMVDGSDVSLASIVEKGTKYAEGDVGVILVGGFGFNYTVTEVDDYGRVLDALITPCEPGELSLSNFDMSEGMSGVSLTYGTSPLKGNGTGLKIKFNIKNYSSLLEQDGEIYDDLFAIVSSIDGLWLYTYKISKDYEESPKLGFWVKVTKISDYEETNVNIKDGYVSLTESYINSIIPTTHELPVSLSEYGKEQTFIEASVTASSINIVDAKHTPIYMENDDRSVDLCRFITTGVLTEIAKNKTIESVMDVLKQKDLLSFDSYLMWRWESYTDPSNRKFEYMLCRRSFNNYVSSDYTSLLPENDLIYNKFVHTNQGTVVSWNVDNIGEMVWLYNPASTMLERYTINTNGRLKIDYIPSTWDKVDIINPTTGEAVSLIDDMDRLTWNIMTNNPYQTKYSPGIGQSIYQQPEYIMFEDLMRGSSIHTINPKHNPIGNWTLVFPRVPSYKLTSSNGETEIDLVPMNCIHTTNLNDKAIISDRNGTNVNDRTIAIDRSKDGISLKIYDNNTKTWISL